MSENKDYCSWMSLLFLYVAALMNKYLHGMHIFDLHDLQDSLNITTSSSTDPSSSVYSKESCMLCCWRVITSKMTWEKSNIKCFTRMISTTFWLEHNVSWAVCCQRLNLFFLSNNIYYYVHVWKTHLIMDKSRLWSYDWSWGFSDVKHMTWM